MNTFLVTRKDGWSPLSELRREMDHIFETNVWYPPCDLEENDDHYLMSLDMPGIPKDQIKIESIDNQITVSGERRQENRNIEKNQTYSERRYGQFYRSFTLPADVNADKVEADYQDGILRLYIPKAESVKPRQIQISNGSSTGFFGRLLGQASKEKDGSPGRVA